MSRRLAQSSGEAFHGRHADFLDRRGVFVDEPGDARAVGDRDFVRDDALGLEAELVQSDDEPGSIVPGASP